MAAMHPACSALGRFSAHPYPAVTLTEGAPAPRAPPREVLDDADTEYRSNRVANGSDRAE
eukprot:11132287-Alexandrium_andersonii.AAC.1